MGSDIPTDYAILLTIQWLIFNHKIIVNIVLKDDNLRLKFRAMCSFSILHQCDCHYLTS